MNCTATALIGPPSVNRTDLRDAAAAVTLRILVFDWLLESQQGRVSAGRREVNRAAIGRHQRHARVLGTGFGGAVAHVTVEDGMREEFGGGALLFEFGQRLRALFRLGLLLLGVVRVRGHGVTVRSGRRWSGDAAVLSSAILQDPLRAIIRLRLHKQEVKTSVRFVNENFLVTQLTPDSPNGCFPDPTLAPAPLPLFLLSIRWLRSDTPSCRDCVCRTDSPSAPLSYKHKRLY